MQYKHKDSVRVELFWHLFNKVYQKATNANKNFNSFSWSTDVATNNFNDLERVYGEGILTRIKGCKFYFKDSVNRNAKFVEVEKSNF